MAVVNSRIALQHLQWLDAPGNHKVVRFRLFASEVSRRFDEVTVHGTWPMATGCSSYHRPNYSSEFRISSWQLSIPKDLILSKNKCLSTSFTRSAH